MYNQLEWQEHEDEVLQLLPSRSFYTEEQWRSKKAKEAWVKRTINANATNNR